MNKIILLGALCCISIISNGQEKLTYNIPVNTPINNIMDIGIDMNMLGKKIGTSTKIYSHITCTGKDENGNFILKSVIDSAIIKVKEGKKDIEMNTNKPETMEGAGSEKIKSMVGKVGRAILKPNGDIEDKSEDEESSIGTIKTLIIKLPSEGLKVGTKWNENTKQELMNQSIEAETTFKVKAIDAKTITIESESDMEQLEDPMITTYVVDKATGMVLSASGKGTMNMMGKMKMSSVFTNKW